MAKANRKATKKGFFDVITTGEKINLIPHRIARKIKQDAYNKRREIQRKINLARFNKTKRPRRQKKATNQIESGFKTAAEWMREKEDRV